MIWVEFTNANAGHNTLSCLRIAVLRRLKRFTLEMEERFLSTDLFMKWIIAIQRDNYMAQHTQEFAQNISNHWVIFLCFRGVKGL